MIELRSVSAGYRGRQVLTSISLAVAPGECVGLIGPSGSGKTTLLRCLTGEVRPTSGDIRIGGWVPGRASPPPGTLGVVWQDPVAALDQRWTIEACVAEPLQAARHPDSRGAARKALAEVRLGHLDPSQRVCRLSVGQAQRVALARALAGRPKAIIADEPTSALDPTNAAAIVSMLHKAAGDGAATLVVSHNEALLSAFCTRIVAIDGLASL